jgi:hypothetical protein
VASYATFEDVTTRAGRYGSLFSVAGKEPDEETIEDLLTNVSDELAAAISARGHDAANLSATEKAALVDVTAYGALARALAGVPGDSGLDELKAYATALWTTGLAGIATGTHALIALLESGGGGASAGSFWEDEPGYDPEGAEETALSDSLAPTFAKGQSL